MYKNLSPFWLTLAMIATSIPAVAADPIRIGLVSETAGPYVDAGANTVNGATLAQEEDKQTGQPLAGWLLFWQRPAYFWQVN